MRVVNLVIKNKLLFAVIGAYAILIVAMPSKAIESSQNSMYYVREMLEVMPVIFILTSLIEAWVPRETIVNGFGEKSGAKGIIFSFLLGSFSAGPIYAAFPICKMLLKKGASVVNVVVILSSWAVIKVPMLANEAKFLGPKFMGIRWVLTTTSILIMGYIISKVINKKSLPLEAEEAVEKAELDIKQHYCIGCGICTKLCPDTFIISHKKAKLIKEKVKVEDIENMEHLDNVIEKCPAKAIYYK